MKYRFINSQTLRQKFSSAEGVAAFDRLEALGQPKWAYNGNREKVILTPTLEVRSDGNLVSPDAGDGKSVDEIAIAFERAIKQLAGKPGSTVVANPMNKQRRKEFTYNKASDTFAPKA